MVRTLITYFEFYTLVGEPETRNRCVFGRCRPHASNPAFFGPFQGVWGLFTLFKAHTKSGVCPHFAGSDPWRGGTLGVVPTSSHCPQLHSQNNRPKTSPNPCSGWGGGGRCPKPPFFPTHHPEEYINVSNFQDKASLRLPRNTLPVPFSI